MPEEKTEQVVLTTPWELEGKRYEASEDNPVTVDVGKNQKKRMLDRGGCREVKRSPSFSKRSKKNREEEEDNSPKQEEQRGE